MAINIYHISEEGNHFQWKTTGEGFKKMRGALMRIHDTTEKGFTYRFVDLLDELRILKPGETLFIDTYPWGAFSERTLEAFNRTAKHLQEYSEGDGGKGYKPNPLNAFCIRRTEARFVYRKLDY